MEQINNQLRRYIKFKIETPEDSDLLEWAETYAMSNLGIYEKYAKTKLHTHPPAKDNTNSVAFLENPTNEDGDEDGNGDDDDNDGDCCGKHIIRPVEFWYMVLTPAQKKLHDLMVYVEMENCPICLNCVTEENRLKTNCGHVFCEPCFINWYKIDDRCAYCRQPVNNYTKKNNNTGYYIVSLSINIDFYYKKNNRIRQKNYYNNLNANLTYEKNKRGYKMGGCFIRRT